MSIPAGGALHEASPTPSLPLQPTAEPIAAGVRYAGFGIRFLAQAIDVVALSILTFAQAVVVVVIAALVGSPMPVMPLTGGRAFWLSMAIGLVSSISYHSLSEWFGGATLGKIVCGLRVRNEALGPASFRGALVRSIAFLVDSLFFGLVAYSEMVKSPLRQRLGDRWGKTVVVHASSLPAERNGARAALGVLLGIVVNLAVSGANQMVCAAVQVAAVRAVDPATVPLTERRRSANGLVTVHYPLDFGSKAIDEGTLLLSRNLPIGGEETVVIGGVEKPVSDRVEEFSRVLEDALRKQIVLNGGTILASETEESSCVGGHPGVSVRTWYRLVIGGTYVSDSCAFVLAERGYLVRLVVTESRAKAERPLLDRIVSAADFGPER